MASLKLLAAGGIISLAFLPSAALADRAFTVHDGETVLTLNADTLTRFGLSVQSASVDTSNDTPTTIMLQPFPSDEPLRIGANSLVSEGAVGHYWGLILRGKAGELYADQVVVPVDLNIDPQSALQLVPSWVRFDAEHATLTVESDVIVGTSAASIALAGDESLVGAHLGRTSTWVNLAQANEAGAALDASGSAMASDADGGVVDRGGCTPNTGPDVIVGDMQSISNYSAVGGIDAFSVGTVSCNIGSVNMNWISGTNDHPVIPQNMYRLKNVGGAARFEQIGQSWMKHAFTALTQNLCCTCNGSGGAVLGVGCSDPYTSGRNGTQLTTTGGLGPRFQVNAHTGAFIFPYMFRNTSHITHNSITRRLQVATGDLDPALNAGATYYVETQYVTPHDARYANQDNNCSHRRVTISGVGGGTNFDAAIASTTQRMQPAIQAWKVADPTVTETWVSTPELTGNSPANDSTGTVIVSSKATDLGGGTWRYEFAVFNMNSDRAVGSFSVPVAAHVNVSNVEFHDVNYHSGDGFGSAVGSVVTYDGTDWPGVKTSDALVWSYVPATPVENSNALRWGTMYNFRFDANAAPATGNVTLGVFKVIAGRPNSSSGAAQIPSVPPLPCPGDVNDSGDVNLTDLAILLTNYGMPSGATPEQGDTDGDGDVDLTDLSAVLDAFGAACPA